MGQVGRPDRQHPAQCSDGTILLSLRVFGILSLMSWFLMELSVIITRKVKVESESKSCLVMSNSLQPHGLYSPRNSPGQNTGVGSLTPLHRIFPTNRWAF